MSPLSPYVKCGLSQRERSETDQAGANLLPEARRMPPLLSVPVSHQQALIARRISNLKFAI